MCGRFMFEPKKNPEINRIYELATSNGYQPKTGEVYPSDQTALVIPGTHQVQVVAMKWGFPGFKPGQLIINARSETVNDKKMFADSFKARRCVYPTTGFFEWSKDKDKYWFNYGKDPEPLYIGGFYNVFQGTAQSILLTTEPNQSVSPIHNRMPLILKKDQIKPWLNNYTFANRFLTATMPILSSQGV
ncbi:SOS response-associated peptidase [Lentilactobacillus kefiri]|uniref:Abasic site processing protein n=2 Tax=Lentilactobacillus kefiri TaxID=33962 RepID=A0A511DS13_LENKE|nr:SOS response-associated peptidase family protein [Lentilactobacillus kefiri]MCP9368182.1 SOS response-associated peptidase [Lentilactobacillus kefiri]MDH5108248.1 SOS response-associated peptidase family protein [Lentilactobacillus kefiri]MDM7492650.1 SOS response-associated peptidase family protein [Lentilactobacillus kefiri]PAK59908.1 DUF159 family protein [Lentilactobacillus kefiri]PAK84271.1 DUF159 family protein [Lentilactobacillus kefiri]